VGEARRTQRNASDPTKNQRRLTVHDAARRLDISEDAVRMRVKRGTLTANKQGGRLYVLLDDDPTTDQTDRTDELIAELRNRVHSLEDQLGQERDANRENRRIIAALTQRIPEIEAPAASSAPTDAPGPPTEATEQPGRVEPQAPVDSVQVDTERVPWWRRLFGE
jgi:hypothetical protein